MHRETVFIVL